MKQKDMSFSAFRRFLAEKCFVVQDFREGKYDRKIYNWFRVGKPYLVDFSKKSKFSLKKK